MEVRGNPVRNATRTMAALAVGMLAATFGFVHGVRSPAHAAPAKAAPPATVKVVDAPDPSQPKGYDPPDITVKVGQMVKWHNKGQEEHSVTADDTSFDSGLTKPGTDFQRAFPTVGVFSYHCAPHPWMKGRVRVVAASGLAASTTTATTARATTTTVAPPPATQAPGGPAAPGGTTEPSGPGPAA